MSCSAKAGGKTGKGVGCGGVRVRTGTGAGPGAGERPNRVTLRALTLPRLTTPYPHNRTLPSYIVYLLAKQILGSQEKTKIPHSPRFRAVKRLKLFIFNLDTTFTFRSGTDSKHTGRSFTRIIFAMFRQQKTRLQRLVAR